MSSVPNAIPVVGRSTSNFQYCRYPRAAGGGRFFPVSGAPPAVHGGRDVNISRLEDIPEQPIIRPPSEARSILVRLTRGCKWNRCRFCGIYPHLGEPDFSLRTVAEVIHDIDLLVRRRPRADTVFFGDADPLEIGVGPFCEIARALRHRMEVSRLTAYARASTLKKAGPDNIRKLAEAGLNRVHIGLESGDPALLLFHRKGQSPEMVKKVALWLHDAGIEVSFYVLLGLGGRDTWRGHISETARVINETVPQFVRLRRLWIYGNDSPAGDGAQCPLWREINAGEFIPQTPEGTVRELRLLIERLEPAPIFLTSDHANNYIRVSGMMDMRKKEMLAEIDAFLALPEEAREAHYQVVGSQI